VGCFFGADCWGVVWEVVLLQVVVASLESAAEEGRLCLTMMVSFRPLRLLLLLVWMEGCLTVGLLVAVTVFGSK